MKEEEANIVTFDEFDFEPALEDSLVSMGFEKATPIQGKAIPVIMGGKDLIACAQTGTGKTAAFLLPVINELEKNPSEKIRVMVVVPTRELALQIDQQLEGFGYFLSVSGIAIYGGSSGANWETQRSALVRGADVVIATPGRMIAHMKQGYVDMSGVTHLILDEADRMLDMGFFNDIMEIANQLPQERQTLMFSATMPPKIRKLAKELLNEPEEITIAVSKTAEGVLQGAYMVYEEQKIPVIVDLLRGKEEELPAVIIFCSTKSKVDELAKQLRRAKVAAKGLHSDLDQQEREEVLMEFRNKKVHVLIATDILSRGIDVEDISLVMNYDVPKDPEDYVHRVGRTARAQRKGLAMTFITKRDQGNFARVEELIGKEIPKVSLPEEVYGKQPEYTGGKGGGGNYSRGGGGGRRRPQRGGKGNGGRRKSGGNRGGKRS
ncbi:RNA helicase [Fulvitalea axinellae]|uniref:RNA helicase n=1 Tax=Fulvitalea axinellae TaxID=1182444 RepID=A0AAU9CVE4_9BACT|nr:RNA helicase [Fulvitalea axinellae]